MKTGDLNALLDRMVELAKIEDALNGIDDNLGHVATGLVNLARDAGLSEDQIIDALAGQKTAACSRCGCIGGRLCVDYTEHAGEEIAL